MGPSKKLPTIEELNYWSVRIRGKTPAHIKEWCRSWGNDYTGGRSILGWFYSINFFAALIIPGICYCIGIIAILQGGVSVALGLQVIGVVTLFLLILSYAYSKNYHKKICGDEYKYRYNYTPFKNYNHQKMSLSMFYTLAYTPYEDGGIKEPYFSTDGEVIGNALRVICPEKIGIIFDIMNIVSFTQVDDTREKELIDIIKKVW